MFLRVSIQAFCATDGTIEALRAMQEDRRLLRAKIDIRPGGILAAIEALAAERSASLLVVETQETGEVFLDQLGRLAAVCDPDTKVVLLGIDNDIHLYRHLIDMGIQEYLPCPVDTGELLSVVERLFAAGDGAARARTIACIGARGGAGSSTVAVNAAYSLAQRYGEDVVLLDLDLAFGTAALSLNLLPGQNIAEALALSSRLDDVMVERFLSRYDEHLSIIASPVQLDSTIRFEMNAFEPLLDIVSARASFVILDLPHLWSSWVHEILIGANEVLVVATADLASLRTTKNLFELLRQRRGVNAPIRLVLNEVGLSRRTEISQKDFEKAVSVKPSEQIASNPVLFGTSLNDGAPVARMDPKSTIAQQFAHLAAVLSGREVAAAKKSNPFSSLRAKILND